MDEAQARKRIQELKRYRRHLASYIAVNLFLFALNMIDDPGDIWFVYVLLGWGIGLAIHTFNVFWSGGDWEQRKLEELTGLKSTQDEVQRLSERMDALVQIMASVNWERIDPQLLDTRRNLEEAQRRLAALERGEGEGGTDGARDDARRREELAREIEKLEAFVTSAKFRYYDMASRQDG